MDLDTLLASLKATAGDPATDAPLVDVASHVAPSSKQPVADRDAARRMLAAFVHWLVTYDRIAPDAPAARRHALTRIARRPDETEKIVEELGDSLYRADIDPAWMDFAAAYLAPGEGHLGDDYFRQFVEEPGGRSLRDAQPSAADYAKFSARVESRARRFALQAADWDRPLDPAGAPEPSLWQGGTEDEWLQRIATYHDLPASLPKVLRSRLAEYWSLVDAAPSLTTPDVASALCETYLWIDDAGIQEAVHRALVQFPPLLVLHGVLAHIVELESRTDWATTVVDALPDELDAVVLADMEKLVDATPLASKAAYRRACRLAGRNRGGRS